MTAGYGGEGTSSGSRADVFFFVSVPCAYKNMVSLLRCGARQCGSKTLKLLQLVLWKKNISFTF
jgi:hypothetical protein